MVNSQNQMLMTGYENQKQVITVMDQAGGHTNDIISKCSGTELHSGSRTIMELPHHDDCILEACRKCDVIRMYNIVTKEEKVVYRACSPYTLCQGPNKSVLVWEEQGEVLQLVWNSTEKKLDLGLVFSTGNHPVNTWRSMCYARHSDILVLLSFDTFTLGMRLSDGPILWTKKNTANVRVRAVTCDPKGRVYMCSDSQVFVVDPLEGHTLQQIFSYP